MNAKKALFWVVIVFFGFWMLTDPNGLADSTQGGWDLTTEFFRGVIDFFGALGD
jgi:hypothetical protein